MIDGYPIRLLLISDTHGRLGIINELASHVQADAVIHAGCGFDSHCHIKRGGGMTGSKTGGHYFNSSFSSVTAFMAFSSSVRISWRSVL